jgi:5-methylcytosine-specific restriction endonuclease McrA
MVNNVLVVEADHWVPIAHISCPGTIPQNIVPLCVECNRAKSDTLPLVWLRRYMGMKRAEVILRQIQEYFDNL